MEKTFIMDYIYAYKVNLTNSILHLKLFVYFEYLLCFYISSPFYNLFFPSSVGRSLVVWLNFYPSFNSLLFQVPYFQVRENNWTFNADINGKWNVRYDLWERTSWTMFLIKGEMLIAENEIFSCFWTADEMTVNCVVCYIYVHLHTWTTIYLFWNLFLLCYVSWEVVCCW